MKEHHLLSFRQTVYNAFNYSCDAAMNLVDALSSYPARSVIELSLSPHFERAHHSIARAIQDYHNGRNNKSSDSSKASPQQSFLDGLIRHAPAPKEQPYRFLSVDVTPQRKPYAHTLSSRHVVHAYTPTPGQKPIAIGHAISCVGESSPGSHWFLPYLSERVPFPECQVEYGLKQVERVTNKIDGYQCIVAADAKYSCYQAIETTQSWKDAVLVSRLSPSRVFLST